MVLVEESKNKKHFVPSESLWLRARSFSTNSCGFVRDFSRLGKLRGEG